MASRTFDLELECGCLLSADGGGALIPCEGGMDYPPDYIYEDLDERQARHNAVWGKFRDSGELAEYEDECKRRNY